MDHSPVSLPMDYKSKFLNSCLTANVLTFGTFTLKSGRVSPSFQSSEHYTMPLANCVSCLNRSHRSFFNAGLFHDASLLYSISTAYAWTLITHFCPSAPSSDAGFDILFGPAYKGIPLATATLSALATLSPERFSHVSYAFNRKENKTHGEGGGIVGAPLRGKRVMIIDDVITAGTAMREAISIIEAEGGTLVGVIVALDRMERMPGEGEENRLSAIGAVKRRYGVPVLSIVTLDDLVSLVKVKGEKEDLRRMEEYRAEWLAKK